MLHTAYSNSQDSYRIHWLNLSFLLVSGVIALVVAPLYIYFYGLSWSVVLVFLFYQLATELSITAGYHRLYAHRTYEANAIVRSFYLLFGAAAFQHSALRWASQHRDHHRFVDRDGDPYSIKRGFMFAHVGWIILKRKGAERTRSAKDLLRDPLVYWQDRVYMPIAILMGYVAPLALGNLLGDAIGCFLLAGVTRQVLAQHATFLINSVCHYVGRQPYSLDNSARDNSCVAALTMGEGYHNFHHRFPYDYRNGVRRYDLDPTKWFIRGLHLTGMARHLRRASEVEIFRARLAVSNARTACRADHRSERDPRLPFARVWHETQPNVGISESRRP